MSNDKKAPQEGIRIQKFLSLAGIASRRHAEELIEQGRVKVSGRVITEMGVHVIPGKSRVEVDNKPVFYSEERNYILFHKPAECITTLDDPEHRTTVIDLLPKSMPRVFPVGRLDWDTEGLLLLTNDGDLAFRLTHPGAKVPRVYHAKVRGELKDTSPEFKKLQFGIELEDGLAKPDRVSILKFTGNNTWIEIELHIGRNRIVRRMCDAIGYPVMKLRRVAFGNLTLDGLALGAFRDLTEAEVASLYAQVGELGDVPIVRSKTGIRYARGFNPKERTMPRQVAPSKEKLEREDETRKLRIEKRTRPSRFKIEDKPERRRPQRDTAPRYEHDDKRAFHASWDDKGTVQDEKREERRSFPRNEKRDERRSFPRNEKREERRSFPRDEKREERRSFPRDEKRGEKRSFPRDEKREERKSFPRDEKRDEKRSFPRNDKRDEKRSFPRDEKREEKRRFPRNDKRDEKRSFPRDEKHEERRSFPRNERRDDHATRHDGGDSGKKRPFAKGVKPKGRR
ncbi:MAG: pseudouridine synthase [Proteobacteria bacterium]|nr:pseudouridine synthase [Pseudomonadota bacterium]